MSVASLAPPAPAALPRRTVDATARALAIAMFAAALVTLAGLVTHAWFRVGHDTTVGLSGLELRLNGIWRSQSWSLVPNAPRDVVVFGYLGLLAGLAAVGVGGAAGAMLLAGRARLPTRAFERVLGVAGFATVMFALRLYGHEPRRYTVGWSGFCAVGGIVALVVLIRGADRRARA